MTDDQITYPVPVGQLLEQLRAQGFSVSPGQYGRVFAVVERVFPEGIPPGDVAEAMQTLGKLIGPLVCCTAAEQERFKPVFDTVMNDAKKELIKEGGTPTGPILITDGPKINTISYLTYIGSFCAILAVCLIGLFLWNYPHPDPESQNKERTEKSSPLVDCFVSYGVHSVQGGAVTFVNRSPGLAKGQEYMWNFGDGSRPVSSRDSLIRHRFRSNWSDQMLKQVVLKAVGCDSVPEQLPETANPYDPSPLSFLSLPETGRYTLSGWLPLLLMSLMGLLGGGWWLNRRGRQQQQAAQRPTGGPFFLSFPPQDNAIQPSPSLISWAQQLQQREESQRHVLAISATIRQTIRNGGMPDVRYESIKRRPRYLILIDDRSAYDQQAKLYAYVMSVLVDRSVEMDVFFFHSDPRYLWNENSPSGLSISDLSRLYSGHYLVLVTEGVRLLDYERGEVADWAVDALSGWTSRALLTPVYPVNWHYLEAALSRFFILLPATPDGQFLLREYLGQPDNVPSFEELLRQFRVLPGTPNRGIFAATNHRITVQEFRNFLNMPVQAIDQQAIVQEWLFTWACATAVFPTPDWAITLGIGRALETAFKVQGLVTSTNILKLTALPWLRQDEIPEPLRTELLAQLSPEAEKVARKTVMGLLNQLEPGTGSVAYEEQQLRLWEQAYHMDGQSINRFSPYRTNIDLIKDPIIQKKVARKNRVENKYLPIGLLLLALIPLLLYLTPPRTQVASVLLPLFRADSVATDSAAFYNNRAITRFNIRQGDLIQSYSQGILDLFSSVQQRITFEAIYNLNASRYNLALLRRNQQSPTDRIVEDEKAVQRLLSPFEGVREVMAPVFLFSENCVLDSATTQQYLLLLATKADNGALYDFLRQAIYKSAKGSNDQSIGISASVDRAVFNSLVENAEACFQSPGVLEFVRIPNFAQEDETQFTKLLTFKPTTTQRDSLISLEAARMVLYYGGPKLCVIIPIEPVPLSVNEPVRQTTAQTQQVKKVEKSDLPPPDQVDGKSDSLSIPTATIERPLTTVVLSTKAIEKQPEVQNPIVKQPSDKEPTSIEKQPEVQNPIVKQSSTKESTKQQPLTEAELRVVLEKTIKCDFGDSLFFSVPKLSKQLVRNGEITVLSTTANLFLIYLYCGSTKPQTIYSKEGFSHIKIELYEKSTFQVFLYQTSRQVNKK